MATQDVKAALPVARLGSGESPIKWSRNRLTFGAASGSIDVATDIYEIGDIKAESALVDGYVIVTTVIPTTSSSPSSPSRHRHARHRHSRALVAWYRSSGLRVRGHLARNRLLASR